MWETYRKSMSLGRKATIAGTVCHNWIKPVPQIPSEIEVSHEAPVVFLVNDMIKVTFYEYT